MGRKALPDTTKAHSSKLEKFLGWGDVTIKTADGKVDIGATNQAFNLALRSHLRSTGEIVAPGGRPKADVDFSNLDAAISHAFAALAKDGKAGLREIQYGTAAALEAPFSDFDRVAKQVRDALDRTEGPFHVVAGATKFEGSHVAPRGTVPAPRAFRKWTQAAPVPATTPAQVEAAAAAQVGGKPLEAGKGKAKGK